MIYLQRFNGTVSADTHAALKAVGLTTFEDLIAPFEERFGVWAHDRTIPDSFVVGHQYDSFDVLIFVGNYDTRAGGMFVLGSTEAPSAVVIKATLSGGKYKNQWLEPGRSLKYYLKSRRGVFGEHFRENATILTKPNVPILAFVRATDAESFTFEGTFKYADMKSDEDGAKWFQLVRELDSPSTATVVDQNFESKRLSDQVDAAIALPPDELQRRLEGAPKVPQRFVTTSIGFDRSPLVIAAVLLRANGVCEGCGSPAPFRRLSDGSPYLEVHHVVRLADGGEDTIANAKGLCPNCHRRAHYG